MPDSTAASDQGNRTSELDEALSNHENLCENQTQPCGDCRRLKATLQRLISQEAARVARAVIGEDIKPHEMFYHGVPVKPGLTQAERICNKLMTEQRRRLDALQGGTKG